MEVGCEIIRKRDLYLNFCLKHLRDIGVLETQPLNIFNE